MKNLLTDHPSLVAAEVRHPASCALAR